MLYGRGRNGKSSLVFVISKLLRGLFSSVHFEEIGIDKFATSDLVGKLLNISSELNATAKLQDGDVKKIISGDTLRAQRKFQPAFDFKPFAKHMICTNNLPRSRDKSLGYFVRFMVVPFHRMFLSQEEYDNIEDEETKKFCAVQDEFLESKLEKELDGIFLWAVYGLKDLLTNQGFCVPEQVQKLKKIFELRSTSVENFLEDIVDDSDCTKDTELQILYRAYIGFCKDYKIPPETYKKFPSSVRELGYEVGPGPGNVTIVKGVCLKE
jgi:putative DNA primase/helicase